MESLESGFLFSENWCAANEKKIADVAVAALIIGCIPTPPTQYYGALVGGTMTLIGFACAH